MEDGAEVTVGRRYEHDGGGMEAEVTLGYGKCEYPTSACFLETLIAPPVEFALRPNRAWSMVGTFC